jgi:hypothetical protein
MTIKTIDKIGILLILGGVFMFGCSSQAPIQKLLDKKVALANGINFDTAKVVALDPETGDEIPACIQPGSATQDRQKSTTNAAEIANPAEKCEVELVISENNPELRAALELSKKPIQGEIKKEGTVKKARFVVTVTTLYEGSTCNVIYSGGDQIENCTPRRKK